MNIFKIVNYEKILVAIDFSEHTSITCNYAFEIAKKNQAEIFLIHTLNDRIISSSAGIPDLYAANPFVNPEINAEIEQNAKEKMLTLKNEMIEKAKNENFSDLLVNTKITSGDFENDLVEFCEDYHPSLVIIGTKGRGGSLNIFGNMANIIIDDLRFPVLAVPEIDNFKGIKNIMYVTDLQASDDVLVRKTYNLLENFDVNMYCVHIVEKNDYLKVNTRLDELKLIYREETEADKFHCDIFESNNKQEEIDEFIKTNNIDLIVFLPHKANIFKKMFGQNFKAKYLFETHLPLLAIRI